MKLAERVIIVCNPSAIWNAIAEKDPRAVWCFRHEWYFWGGAWTYQDWVPSHRLNRERFMETRDRDKGTRLLWEDDT